MKQEIWRKLGRASVNPLLLPDVSIATGPERAETRKRMKSLLKEAKMKMLRTKPSSC